MADLSAYLDFSVQIDKSVSTPVIKVTNTGSYPAGVAATITGIVSISQPDDVTVFGSFTNPDMVYSSGVLTVASKEYRLATDGSFQKGVHSVTLTIRATGYADTILTKTFNLQYAKPTIDITELVDVFTPVIEIADATVYAQPEFATTTVTRAWSVDVYKPLGSKRTITGSTSLLSLAYSGNYYDALYSAAFTATLLYTGVTYTYLTLKDKLTAQKQFDAYTPPTLGQLLDSITQLKTDSVTGCCGDLASLTSRATKAEADFGYITSRGASGQTVGLGEYVRKLQRLLHGYVSYATAHTNLVIPPYVWNSFTIPGNVVIQLPPGTTSWVAEAATLIEKFVIIAPTGIVINIGKTINGSEYWENIGVNGDTGNVQVLAQDIYFPSTTTIYFTGVQPDTIIKIYKR